MIIVIEGTDQAGKKTQTELLAKALRKLKLKTKVFSFPDYSTPTGREIKQYLSGKKKFSPLVVHCLLAANRWEKLDEIEQANSTNSVLIMNRYFQSNLVYGLVNGMNLKWLESLDKGLPKPDLVIVLDVSPTTAFHRKKTKRDKFEKDKKFLEKISNTYKKLAKKKKWKIVKAVDDKITVHQKIMRIFLKKLGI